LKESKEHVTDVIHMQQKDPWPCNNYLFLVKYNFKRELDAIQCDHNPNKTWYV